ncbi:helix-turn-helix domain-containing protein [Nocardiopsis sp. NRRL B-16309]|uniref:helix-turn-helix domain-containing protein n=1 Tax=Nocardiopsis sp. NRRL B-16309 TaxID=1519494 RepID=UPI0009EBB3F7|nr:helix-turn-helix transcriptional regulator [Nocardiopsis sp. NRRL B-16309]
MTEEQARQFGEYIKRLREAKQWGVRELARSSGVSPALISLLEKGYQRPKVDTLKALAGALDVPFAEMMHHSGYERECGKPCIGVHLRLCYSHIPEETIQEVEEFANQAIANTKHKQDRKVSTEEQY